MCGWHNCVLHYEKTGVAGIIVWYTMGVAGIIVCYTMRKWAWLAYVMTKWSIVQIMNC